jgi:hypothetical protein
MPQLEDEEAEASLRRKTTAMLINAKPRISVERGSGVGVGVNGRFDPATPANSNETTPLVAVTVVKGVVVSTTRYALPPGPWYPLLTKPAAAA